MPPLSLISFIFMQFSAKPYQITEFYSKTRGLYLKRSTPLGNTESATVHVQNKDILTPVCDSVSAQTMRLITLADPRGRPGMRPPPAQFFS